MATLTTTLTESLTLNNSEQGGTNITSFTGINELEIEVAKLKRLSHPPIFTAGERDEILKRLTRIENYLKRR